jgi:hypothetical protein
MSTLKAPQFHNRKDTKVVRIFIKAPELEITKVTESIPAFELFPHPRITPFCIFSHLFMHMFGTIPEGAINASA